MSRWPSSDSQSCRTALSSNLPHLCGPVLVPRERSHASIDWPSANSRSIVSRTRISVLSRGAADASRCSGTRNGDCSSVADGVLVSSDWPGLDVAAEGMSRLTGCRQRSIYDPHEIDAETGAYDGGSTKGPALEGSNMSFFNTHQHLPCDAFAKRMFSRCKHP